MAVFWADTFLAFDRIYFVWTRGYNSWPRGWHACMALVLRMGPIHNHLSLLLYYMRSVECLIEIIFFSHHFMVKFTWVYTYTRYIYPDKYAYFFYFFKHCSTFILRSLWSATLSLLVPAYWILNCNFRCSVAPISDSSKPRNGLIHIRCWVLESENLMNKSREVQVGQLIMYYHYQKVLP